jgi:AcrR family transcriptional regulator
MPKLWTDTIEDHRSAVAGAVLDKTAALAASEGLHNLTMARIAQETGIGRATLYKYFGDVEAILTAWHTRQIESHLTALGKIREHAQSPREALEAVLLAYGENMRHSHGHALGSLMHSLPHARNAHRHLQDLVASIIEDTQREGAIEAKTPANELARYALAAVQAGAPNRPALTRLVGLVMRGLGGGP